MQHFRWSFVVTAVCMVLAGWWDYAHRGWPGLLQALWISAILGVLEVSLSFDNAVVNAAVLKYCAWSSPCACCQKRASYRCQKKPWPPARRADSFVVWNPGLRLRQGMAEWARTAFALPVCQLRPLS